MIYGPARFRADEDVVAGGRIVLLEDLWVSGRTWISAAGALVDAGAEAVAIMPIARRVTIDNPVMATEDHPLFESGREPSWSIRPAPGALPIPPTPRRSHDRRGVSHWTDRSLRLV